MQIGKDHIITAYRDHGIALALGVDAKPIMAEMMGKTTGTGGGKGGSMHIASGEHNFWGGYAIVGGHLPLAAGIALEAQYNQTGAAVISFIGDGATNNGYFHETLNMAGAWKLPVVWIIENNGYGMGTDIDLAAGNPVLHQRAVGYGIKDMERVDGQDVFKVYDTVQRAMDYARAGHGSVLIEAITYRYRGHGVSDKQYDTRMADELAEWKANKDPITLLRSKIMERYKNVEHDLSKINAEVKKVVAESVEFAENSPLPDTLEYLMSNIYVGQG
jgi:pyruvate dehydrogenase E1 component alpha subunit